MKRAFLVVAVVAAAGGGVRAEKLDPAACEALRGEQAGLVAAGVRRDMERGPEWARANLGRDRLQQIAKLMSVDEQLIFRCATLHPRPAPTAETATTPPKAKKKQPKVADGDAGAEAKPKKKKAAAAEVKDVQSDEAPKPARNKSKPAAEGTEAPPPATGATPAATAEGGDAVKPRKSARKATKPDDAFAPPAAGKE